MFPANFTFENIVRVIFVGAPAGVTPVGEAIPTRFFELISIDIFEGLKTVLVFNGADGFLLLLTIGGLAILIKHRKRLTPPSQFLLLIGFITIFFIPIGLALQVGMFRVVYFASPLFPVFSGVFIAYTFDRKTLTRILIFSLILFSATLELYKCQPLLPPASTLSQELSSDQPIYYLNTVNTIYQRQKIEFVER